MSKIDTIAKLFSQAADEEKNGNSEAGQNYSAHAMKLCVTYGISEAEARAAMDKDQKANTLVIKNIQVGKYREKGLKYTVNALAGIAQSITGVKCDLAHNGTYLVAYGTESQIVLAEQLVDSILDQMAAADKQARKEYKKNPETNFHGDKIPFSQASFRRGFLYQLQELSDKIKFEQDQELKEQTEQSDQDDSGTVYHAGTAGVSTNSSAIAVRDLDLEVQDFYKMKSRARGTFNLGSVPTGAGFKQGSAAGKSATLSTNKSIS